MPAIGFLNGLGQIILVLWDLKWRETVKRFLKCWDHHFKGGICVEHTQSKGHEVLKYLLGIYIVPGVREAKGQ